MAYFSSIQNFIDTITAKFNKPKRSLSNDGIVKQDIIDALTDAAKYADDVKKYGEMLNASFITRSLNLAANIYIDGTTGDDSRTGVTNDNNALTGRVKSFSRIAALHSGKTYELNIYITGIVIHAVDTTLKIPFANIINNGTLTYAKKVAQAENGVIYGDATSSINWECQELNILNQGTINVEAHAGSTGNGNQFLYRLTQGANRLTPSPLFSGPNRIQLMNVAGSGSINVGNNTTFATPGGTGIDSYAWNYLSIYRRSGIIGGAVNLGTNATEHMMQGDRLLPRSYTPTSSTDANVSDREIVADNNFLYRKNGGIIKKVGLVNF